MITKSAFVALAREHFAPLLDRHGIRYRRSTTDAGSHAALFTGESRAMEVSLDQRDGLVEIYVYKAEAESVIRNPSVIDRSSMLTGFNIDDFLSVSEGRALPRGALVDRDSIEEVSSKLQEYVRAIARFQDELLTGEFHVPPEVERRIKERARARS